MKEDGRMGKNMVKEHTLGLMEKSMLGSSRMGKGGMEHITTKMEKSVTGK